MFVGGDDEDDVDEDEDEVDEVEVGDDRYLAVCSTVVSTAQPPSFLLCIARGNQLNSATILCFGSTSFTFINASCRSANHRNAGL